MKNCADSAAQAITMAAARIAGAVQRTDHGPTSAMGSAPSSSSANTGRPTGGLLEGDFIASRDNRMFLEIRARNGEIHAVVSSAAFFARQRTACDEQRHRVNVAQLVHRQRCTRGGLRNLGDQRFAR